MTFYRSVFGALVVLFCGSLFAIADSSVRIGWTPSTTTNVVAYRLYYGPLDRGFVNWMDVTNQNYANLCCLIPGETYFFKATGFSNTGVESGPSAEFDYTVPVPVPAISGSTSNAAPTLDPIANVSVAQNSGPLNLTLSWITSGSDSESQPLTVFASSSNPSVVPTPVVTYLSPARAGTLTLTPATNAMGNSTITVYVDDGQPVNHLYSRSFVVTVQGSNMPPTLDAITNRTVLQNSGAFSVPLSGVTSGSASELQTLIVRATSSNPTILPDPTVIYSSPSSVGTLSMTPVAGAVGIVTVTVTVDDGQTSNNLVTRSFTVTVAGPNAAPTLDPIASLTVAQNSGAKGIVLSWITSGSDTEVQPLTVTATSSNPSVIPTPVVSYVSPNRAGTLTFKPATDAMGTSTITVYVDDGQLINHVSSRSFVVTVVGSNLPPTLNAISSISLPQNSAPQSIALSGISSGSATETQTLVVTATSSDRTILPDPAVTYSSPSATGSLLLAPVAGALGTAAVTVTVNDGQSSNNLLTRSFTVSISGTNAKPTLDPIANVSVLQNSGPRTLVLSWITSGSDYEFQPLTVTATSANPSVVPTPVIAYVSPTRAGSLTFTPATNAVGTATITVFVDDGQLVNHVTSRSFTVTVTAPTTTTLASLPDSNEEPNLSDLVLDEDSGVVEVPLTGIVPGPATEEHPTPIVSLSDHPEVIPDPTISYEEETATYSLLFAPVSDAFGVATISVIVNDPRSTNGTTTRTFTVTVNPVNDPPTLDPLGDLSGPMNSGIQAIFLSGISSGAWNEQDHLRLAAFSSDPSIIPNPTIEYTSPSSNAVMYFTPLPNARGTTTLTVLVNDGQPFSDSIARSFTVTVIPPPVHSLYSQFESGMVTPPMMIGANTNAANGLFVFSPSSQQGRVTVQLEVPQAGNYYVWARVLATNSATDSFYFTLDSTTEQAFPTSVGEWSPQWRWIQLKDWILVDGVMQSSGRIFPLTEGNHAFSFRCREAFTALDALYVTDDLDFVPTDTVDDGKGGLVSLPDGWSTMDIGTVSGLGGLNVVDGAFLVEGTGNISGTEDNFQFVYQRLVGDGEIVAQISAPLTINSDGRLGVMIRQELTSGSPYVFLGTSPELDYRWQQREESEGETESSTWNPGTAQDLWVHLVRKGNTFYGYVSLDGDSWELINVSSVEMTQEVVIGLAVVSGTLDAPFSATFSNVAITQ